MAEEGRDKYLAKEKGYNRPAVNFTRRDDVRDFARSGIGQNYHRMMDLQSQKNPNLDQLKQARRQWNRYDKYNAGRMLGKTPQQMQKEYMDTTETFRQANNPAYTKMYPVTGNFMNIMEKGGLWGSMLSQLAGKTKNKLVDVGRDIKDKIGIMGNVDDIIDVQDRYVTETFGPHRTDIEELDFTDEYEGPWPHEDMPTFPDIYRGPRPHQGLPPLDVYEGRRPHEGMPLLPVEAGQPPAGAVDVTGDPTRKRDVGYDITASDLDVAPSPNPNIVDMDYWNWVDQFYDTHNPDGTPKSDPTVISGGGTSYVDRFAPIEEEIVEEVTSPIPFDDSGRESGIRGLAQHLKPNKYEDEFRAYIESGAEFMPYHQFERMYEKIYQGKPHALHSSYR